MRSQDDGVTWRWPQVLFDGPTDSTGAARRLVAVWYETLPGSPLAQLRQVRWRAE